MKILIDTGSSVNLLSVDLVREMGLTSTVEKAEFRLVGVTGAPLQTCGLLRKTPIMIQDKLVYADFIVTKLTNEECILGQGFCSDNGVVIDFKRKTVGNAVFTTYLAEVQSTHADKSMMLVSDNDALYSGLDTIKCHIELSNSENEENGTQDYEYYTGFYFIELSEEMQILSSTLGETEKVPIYANKGKTEIPIAVDSGSVEVWIPGGQIIAIATPCINTANLVKDSELQAAEKWEDDDPERIKAIMQALNIEENENLNRDQKDQVLQLMKDFPDIWALDRSELGITDLVYHDIPLTTDKPVRAPYRRVPLHLREDCIQELEALLKAGVIEHSQSNYNTPAIVLKKGPKTRIILDFRVLNKYTERSFSTVPALNTVLAGCHAATMFTSLDFRDGFLQIPLNPDHRKYTAFAIPGIGFFQFVVMCLGLCGSPGTFQNLLDRVLAGIAPEVASVFVDDILSPAKDFDTMLQNLNVIFGRIRTSKLRLNPAKCSLFKSELKYCGVYLTRNGIVADHVKTQAVKNMSPPRNLKDVRRFLGCANWFRPHIKRFAELAKGLTDTLKGEQFVMTDEAHISFEALKEALTSPPVLIYPKANEELIVYTDASEIAIAGCIGHKIDGLFHPIAYSSKILNDTECRWASFKREFYSLWYHVTECWRYYLVNTKFTCYVDMKAITYDNFLKKTNSAMLLRWIMGLADYDFTIKYQEGRLLEVPDCLSRMPQTSDELFNWWRDFSSSENRTKTTKEYDESNEPSLENRLVQFHSGLKVHSHEINLVENQNLLTNDDDLLQQEVNEARDEDEAMTEEVQVSAGVSSDIHSEEGTFQNPIPAFNSVVMLEKQRKDNDLVQVKGWLEAGVKPVESTNSATMSDSLRKYWNYFDHLSVSKHGLICYKYFFSKSKKFKELICVPIGDSIELIKNHHEVESCGHLGPIKTVHRIREKYYFNHMNTEVKQFCGTCSICFINNQCYYKNPKAPLKLFPAVRPNQFLSIDLVGQIKGPGRYNWILTMLDRFTRFVQAVPLVDAESPTIAKALLDHWFWKYGIPEKILSDRAGNLTTSITMKVLYSLMNIYKVKTTAYHARGNGQCENYNKHIVVVLKKLVDNNPKIWPTKLNVACFALNSSICATTQFTPFKLQFGRELRSPTDLIYDTTTTTFYKSGAHLAERSYYEIREVFDLVRANNVQGLMRQKAAYDKKKGFHTTYKVGDQVLLWKPLSQSVKDYRKFKNCFSGPWIIEQIYSSWTYGIRNVKTQRFEVAHYDSMRYLPENLRTEMETVTAKRAPVQEGNVQQGTAESVDLEESTELLQTMFGASTGYTQDNVPIILEVEGPETRKSGRTVQRPERLQVGTGTGQRYEDL